MQGRSNEGESMDSSLSRENGVVKSRSLLGHFHRFHSPSGSKKAHKRRDALSMPGCLWHIRRDFTTKESVYNNKRK